MKRYRPSDRAFRITYGDSIQMIEDPNGEWVKYDEVKLMIETKSPDIKIETVECNCKEKSVKGIIYWICPTHGYKFLGIPLRRE